MKNQRKCGNCGQPSHRADRCPESAKGSAVAPPKLTEAIAAAAREYGQAVAAQAVEQAVGDVLSDAKQMRLALIKSRRQNQHLRNQLKRQGAVDVEVETKALEKLDREEKKREMAMKHAGD